MLNLANHVGETNKRDAAGLVMPWFTWPALDALELVDFSGKSIFEWGTGFGTVWFHSRGARILSVDHDLEWTDAINVLAMESNHGRGYGTGFEVGHCAAPPEEESADIWHYYPQTLSGYTTPVDGHDFIVIDGVMRVACAIRAPDFIRAGGTIIIDNSDRPEMRDIGTLYTLLGLQEQRFEQPDRPWRTTFWKRP